jgi:hypothetical protein
MTQPTKTNKTRERCGRTWKIVLSQSSKIRVIVCLPWVRARGIIEQEEPTFPRSDTVLLSLLSLVLFLISAVFALVFPTRPVKFFIFALNATLAIVLSATVAFDLFNRMYTNTNTKEPQ